MKKMFAMGLSLGISLSFIIIFISLFIALLSLIRIGIYCIKLNKLKKMNKIEII